MAFASPVGARFRSQNRFSFPATNMFCPPLRISPRYPQRRPRILQCRIATTDSVPGSDMHVFIYGIGYVGLQFALAMKTRGARVSGTTRSAARAVGLRRLGFDVIAADEYEDGTVIDGLSYTNDVCERLQVATHLLSTAGPDADGDPFLAAHGACLTESALKIAWIGYLSSTSAYGNHNGHLVDEVSSPKDPGWKGEARLAAENAWKVAVDEMNNGSHLNTFRLAGIYGPGRSALDTLLRRPKPLESSTDDGNEKLTSRVHVDDIVATLIMSIETGSAGTYNVADDMASSRKEVFQFARDLIESGNAGKACQDRLRYLDHLGAENPQSVRPPSSRDRARASKRVSNKKMRAQLLHELSYPTFRDGLTSIADAYAGEEEQA